MTSDAITTGTKVQFRNDFSAELVGLTFEVDTDPIHTDRGPVVGLRIKLDGRWCYRTAKVANLNIA